jgi:hypothetical protein
VYSTCLFCHSDLGTNEVIEEFPIGRRLAFDGSMGRLWVVCRKCERWNLTPLEERWEAIEEAERLFSATRLRASTDNIGLARLREGLELVRIGSAMRPEFAAWRYGDQFGKRRRRHLIYTTAGAVALGGLVIAGPATGLIAGGGWGLWQGLNALQNVYQKKRPRLRLALPGEQRVVTLRKDHLAHTGLTREGDGQWVLHLSYDPGAAFRLGGRSYQMLEVRGEHAMRIAGKVLPKINDSGAKSTQVQDAVKLIESSSSPDTLFRDQARVLTRGGSERAARSAAIAKFPLEVRLALEMAAHEEQERRALEGELALLETAWRQAEEVAHIADDLLLPESTAARLEELKQKG